MAATIVTLEDLQTFKTELLKGFKELLSDSPKTADKKWLRSREVRQMLNISPGTLQNLRVNQALPYTKVGGIVFYDAQKIEELLQASNKKLN